MPINSFALSLIHFTTHLDNVNGNVKMRLYNNPNAHRNETRVVDGGAVREELCNMRDDGKLNGEKKK